MTRLSCPTNNGHGLQERNYVYGAIGRDYLIGYAQDFCIGCSASFFSTIVLCSLIVINCTEKSLMIFELCKGWYLQLLTIFRIHFMWYILLLCMHFWIRFSWMLRFLRDTLRVYRPFLQTLNLVFSFFRNGLGNILGDASDLHLGQLLAFYLSPARDVPRPDPLLLVIIAGIHGWQLFWQKEFFGSWRWFSHQDRHLIYCQFNRFFVLYSIPWWDIRPYPWCSRIWLDSLILFHMIVFYKHSRLLCIYFRKNGANRDGNNLCSYPSATRTHFFGYFEDVGGSRHTISGRCTWRTFQPISYCVPASFNVALSLSSRFREPAWAQRWHRCWAHLSLLPLSSCGCTISVMCCSISAYMLLYGTRTIVPFIFIQAFDATRGPSCYFIWNFSVLLFCLRISWRKSS